MNDDKRNSIKNRINSLKGEMDSLDDQLEINNYDMNPTDDLLPRLELDYEIYDYDKEIKEISEDCKVTLQCISNLYLTSDDLKKKNINKIVENDSKNLADLKFSLSCSKRALISLMKQLDMGINDPEMYEAVSTFQKEIRDSVKMLSDLQTKVKNFYRDLKTELNEINSGDNLKENTSATNNSGLHLLDKKQLNQILDDLDKKKKNEIE